MHFPFESSAWARYDKVYHDCVEAAGCVVQVRFRSASKPDPLSPPGLTRQISLAVGAPLALGALGGALGGRDAGVVVVDRRLDDAEVLVHLISGGDLARCKGVGDVATE